MNQEEIRGILAGYRQGAAVDALQFYVDGKWGVLWAVPSPTPGSLERAARQGRRAGACRLRHIRRARLRRTTGDVQDIVVVTELPAHRQEVYDLHSGEPVPIRFCEDAGVRALAVIL